MAILDLPALPTMMTVEPYLLDFGVEQRGQLGGETRRYSRLGSRWGLDLEYPAFEASCARAILAVLLKARAEGSTVRVALPVAAQSASFGSLLVNGGSQAGTSLVVDGGTASATVPKGYFFSVVVSGQTYLYCTTADTVLSGGGAGTLSIAPMLRVSPADNAALEFTAPKIEGLAPGDSLRWSMELLQFYGLSLSLQERA